MANSYGNKTLFTETIGRSISVTADGAPKYKAGGITIDWDTVPAIGEDDDYTLVSVVNGQVTFQDGVVVKEGEKVLRYGSVVVKQEDGTYALATSESTLVKGETYVVAETTLEEDAVSAHPPVIDGGRVFKDRLLVGGAVHPSFEDFEAAMPGILYVVNEQD